MITRGYYIGEIIDAFATISSQVKTRNRLNLTDLSGYAENFCRDVVNILQGAQLRNLNEVRSNEPGLDLGDEKKKLAIQVTARANSEKVNDTLRAVTEEHLKKYDRIVVLALGQKQSSYSLDDEAATRAKFNWRRDIWDFDTLARQAISLQLEDLKKLFELVRDDTVRLRVELEVPDENGEYPTSNYDQWEGLAAPSIGAGKKFRKFCETQSGEPMAEKDAKALRLAIEKLGSDLAKLPRITREFLASLFERREKRASKRMGHRFGSHLLYDKLRRVYHGNDLDGELRILDDAGLAYVDGEDAHETGPAEVIVCVSKNDDLAANLEAFIDQNGLSYREVIGKVDFSAF